MVSIKIARCSSPRPETMKVSGRRFLLHAAPRYCAVRRTAGHAACARYPTSLLAGKGRGIDPKGHPYGGFFHLNGRKRHRVFRIGQRFANRDPFQPGNGDDLAGFGFVPLPPSPDPGKCTGSVPAQAKLHHRSLSWPIVCPALIQPAKIRPMAVVPR